MNRSAGKQTTLVSVNSTQTNRGVDGARRVPARGSPVSDPRAAGSGQLGGKAPGLAWGLARRDHQSLVSQAGGSAGYRSFIGNDPSRRVGVVVVSNVNLLAWLRGRRYVGRYRIDADSSLMLSRKGARFFARVTGQRARELLASSEREFLLKDEDATLGVELDEQSRAVACTVHQNGKVLRAPRSP